MKQIKMNYSPGPPSHPLTSKRGKRSVGGQIKALWPRVTSVLVVHLRAVERKTVPTGGLWLLEPRSPAGRAARSSAWSQSVLGELDAAGGPRPSSRAEIELDFEEINQSAENKTKQNKNGSRGLGRVVASPSPTRVVRAGGRRLRTAPKPRLPPQLLSLDVQKEELPSSPPSPPPPRLVPHTHPRWPADPFPHLFFPSSEKSLAPEPAPAESFLSPLPLPRGPPPAIAPATTSVPLNRFLLHVNTYYRKGEDGAASHYPEDIFRGSRRSGGSEGNLRTSERGPLSCPRTVVCTSLGTTNPESDPQLPPRAHLPLASPPRCSSLASKPRRWAAQTRPGVVPGRSARPRAPLAPARASRARAAASWAVAAPARALPLGCASRTPAGPGPRTRWLLRGLRGGLGRPRPEERPVPAPTPATSLLTLSRASAPSFPSGHIP
ncbi:serine/arginine repetitive matrix protein 1-like [Vulpes lagopus]|uniref:serine/arginine repetitive matrix protein 1-like n=1 Tax=Vulpes lagopus TaxID=494514 RepID=UPI001BC8D2C6|nr:serine/arginine repetitive matrix protein 1-like [Vulpes lagopus]